MNVEKEWIGKWSIVTPEGVLIIFGVLSYKPGKGCVLKASADSISTSDYKFLQNILG